jgi:hypothetical protein
LDRWIVIHWFELTALGLLCLNLWFVFEVLKVLRAVKDWLMMLADWLDKTRGERKQEAGAGIKTGDDP